MILSIQILLTMIFTLMNSRSRGGVLVSFLDNYAHAIMFIVGVLFLCIGYFSISITVGLIGTGATLLTLSLLLFKMRERG